jgi:hypothetical protein
MAPAQALPKCTRAMWKRGRMAVPEQLEQGGGHWKKTRMAHSRSPISAAVMHMHSLGSVWVHNLKARSPSCFILPLTLARGADTASEILCTSRFASPRSAHCAGAERQVLYRQRRAHRPQPRPPAAVPGCS